METASKVTITETLSKILNRKKISNEQYNVCEVKISLGEIIKFINSQINNKSSANYSLAADFYKNFSNKLAPVLLDVFNFWGKFGTMGVTSKQEHICRI